MKVFISHKKEDENNALSIQKALCRLNVDAYLDVLDPSIEGDGEALTKHVREVLKSCTDLIVVLSQKTKGSWWVPFEIGMATEKDLLIANYLIEEYELPDFLSFWPCLTKHDDIAMYIDERREMLRMESALKAMSQGGFSQIKEDKSSSNLRFYRRVKERLSEQRKKV